MNKVTTFPRIHAADCRCDRCRPVATRAMRFVIRRRPPSLVARIRAASDPKDWSAFTLGLKLGALLFAGVLAVREGPAIAAVIANGVW